MPTRRQNKGSRERRVMGRVAAEHFVGRDDALAQIAALAPHASGPRGLAVLAAPFSGASELLRQAYDRLFNERGGASPVYFAVARSDRTGARAARRFLNSFLVQLVAHRRDNPELLLAPPALRDLLDLVTPSDYEWVERIIASYERARDEGDERAVVRLCLSAPQQAAARGSRSVVLLDDVHSAEYLAGDLDLNQEIAQIAAQSEVPFVFAGLRRRLSDFFPGLDDRAHEFAPLRIENLAPDDARRLAENAAWERGVALSAETRDLLVQQLEGSPYFITAVVRAAKDKGRSLTSFGEFQKVYVDELLGGRVGRRLTAILEEIAPPLELRRALLRVLHESAENVGGRSPVEAWSKRLGLDGEALLTVLEGLHAHELVSFNGTFVQAGGGTPWRDYLRAGYRLQVAAEPRALVVADALVDGMKRAPQTMARHYRREASSGLRELLTKFDQQRVPASLLHNDRFNRMYRGVTPEEVAAGLDAETDLVRLPQVVHSASCAAFHPPILLVADEERCAVAHGFDAAPYTDASEVVWLAAEIESKLEAGRALAEVWCERLAQVAHACGFRRVRLWLVAPEGFSAEANELLNEREAFGSSRAQLELLGARLSADVKAKQDEGAPDEFEMVIPMGEDSELIAASTVEQIARRLDFQPEAINQIKTALVEACINAAEHSLSPDRKIYQRFRLESDKLVVTVSSRGISLPTANLAASQTHEQNNGHDTPEAGRRGWGLKLIRTLMDEVEFERVDDGTRLRMTKYLRK
ncbi:MAG TPA: ATP-binding protein [Pyrinomonadaceae bacterium]|nr:ATP-binding protein [Pyrinomonadaceae bacterium]